MPTKPTELPLWNTDDLNNTPPNLAKKQLGWIVGDIWNTAYTNWWQKLVYEWTEFIDNAFGDWENPDATDAITNQITPLGLVKAYGRIFTDGAGNLIVEDAMNVASVSLSTTYIHVDFAGIFSAEPTSVASGIYSGPGTARGVEVTPTGTGSIRIYFKNSSTGAVLNPQSTSVSAQFISVGRQ